MGWRCLPWGWVGIFIWRGEGISEEWAGKAQCYLFGLATEAAFFLNFMLSAPLGQGAGMRPPPRPPAHQGVKPLGTPKCRHKLPILGETSGGDFAVSFHLPTCRRPPLLHSRSRDAGGPCIRGRHQAKSQNTVGEKRPLFSAFWPEAERGIVDADCPRGSIVGRGMARRETPD